MRIKDIVELLDAEVFTKEIYDENIELNYAFGSDLMSDALMLLRTAPDDFFEQGMLLTGLVTKQSVRTAEMLDFKLIVIVRGKKPNENVYEAAIDSNIIVVTTPYSMFSASGRLYQNGIKGVSEL